MKHFSYSVCLMALVISLSGCYSHRAVGLLQERDNLPKYEKAEYEPYRLQVNDEIIYRLITMDETISKVMGTTETASTSNINSYRIYSDGTVDLPFLAPIHLEGLTLDSAEQVVQTAFREVIPDAEIKLSINNKTFVVIGDISKGTYSIYKDRLTIFQALAMTGDVANSGDRKHIRIIRPHGNDKPEVLEFDLRTNTIIDSKYYYVYPNDVIYVSRDKGAFYKVTSYAGFVGLITSSVSLLVSVLNYTTTFLNK